MCLYLFLSRPCLNCENEKKICPLAKNANVHLQKILKAKCIESGPDK